jgi:hypothetical protein
MVVQSKRPATAPASIIKTRVPRELQAVFLASWQGEVVQDAPVCAVKVYTSKWIRLSTPQDASTRKARLSFGDETLVEFDQNESPLRCIKQSASCPNLTERCGVKNCLEDVPDSGTVKASKANTLDHNRWGYGAAPHALNDATPRLPRRAIRNQAA